LDYNLVVFTTTAGDWILNATISGANNDGVTAEVKIVNRTIIGNSSQTFTLKVGKIL
jgi:hypothetical protein